MAQDEKKAEAPLVVFKKDQYVDREGRSIIVRRCLLDGSFRYTGEAVLTGTHPAFGPFSYAYEFDIIFEQVGEVDVDVLTAFDKMNVAAQISRERARIEAIRDVEAQAEATQAQARSIQLVQGSEAQSVLDKPADGGGQLRSR